MWCKTNFDLLASKIKTPLVREGPNFSELNPGQPETNPNQRPVSGKSRNFAGHFRVSQFRLYLKNGEALNRQT